MADKFKLPIDDMPDLAAAIGRLIIHWSFLEVTLKLLTSTILEIDTHKAQIIYDGYNSIRSKIDILKKINHQSSLKANIKEKIDGFLDKAEKLNKTRNSYIHSFWVVSGNTLGKVSKGIVDKITPDKVQNVIDEIAELSLSLHYFLFPGKQAPTR